ncbi:MAG: hypothetical protein HQ542_09710 [Bacteroidia bacterium]|nr:hypothetical protein [Bacteroidia bacterium]
MKAQVYMDGNPLLPEPILYKDLPDDTGSAEGLHLGTYSPGKVKIKIKNLYVMPATSARKIEKERFALKRWGKYATGGLKIQEDTPEKGMVTLNDNIGKSSGSAFLGLYRLCQILTKDWGISPSETEYEFGGTLAFSDVGWYSHDFKAGDNFGVGKAYNTPCLNAMLRRECGMMLSRGHGFSLLEIQRNAYCNDETFPVIKEIVDSFNYDTQKSGQLEADVAVFASEKSLDYLSLPRGLTYRWYLLRHQRRIWDKSGVPYDWYIQKDITHPDLPDYKVYIFVAPEYLSKEELAAIQNLKRDGKVLIFYHAPGVVGADDPQITIQDITGIKVKKIAEEMTYAGTYLLSDHVLFEDLFGTFGNRPAYGAYMTEYVKGDAYEIIDKNVLPIATFSNSDKIAVAMRDFGSWKSIFCAIPRIDTQFFHNIAKWSDSWYASETLDAVFANQHFVIIHALTSGQKKLFFKQRVRKVVDIVENKIVASDTDSMELAMEVGQTKWFRLEN